MELSNTDEIKSVAEVTEEVTEEVTAGEKTEAELIAENERYLKELVEIKLFIDNDRYKDDLIVMHNGKAYQIQRGVPVMVPRFIKEIIDQSEEQDGKTARMINDYHNQYEEKAKNFIG